MKSYQFLKDWTGGTYTAPGVGIATMQVSYKKDEIISNGKLITNDVNSEPPNFIEFFDPTKGTIRVPFGGKYEILKEYTYGPGGNPNNPTSPTGFSLKKVLVTVAVIGGIFGILKWTKVI